MFQSPFQIHITCLRLTVTANESCNLTGKNPTKPSGKNVSGIPAKTRKLSIRIEERILDDVRRIRLPA